VEALLRGSAPAGEAARPHARARVLHAHALTLASGLCASLPVIVATARALRAGWQPVADRGIIATRAFDVFSSHMPLVGQYSFAGTVTSKLTYSLGPMLYWLLAPAAHVGAPQSFVLTMAVVNVACILGAVALARRRGGAWLMVAAAVGIALMCRSLAANNFYDIWNPSAGLFPLVLLVFVCWSLACGEHRLLALAVLLASFEAQCEDSFVPASLGLMAVGLGGLALCQLQLRRRRAPLARRGAWRWMLAALAVFAICWTPPLIDQVAHSGNFGLVLAAATERKSSLGPTVGMRAVIRTVGVTPWWLTRPSDPFVRKIDVRHSAGTLADVSAALILGWLLLAIALAIRRRRFDVVAGSATALVLCAAVFSIANATPTTPLLSATLGYTLWSATAIGMFVWLIAGWSAVVLGAPQDPVARLRAAALRARIGAAGVADPAVASIAGVALVALAGGASAASGAPDEHGYEFAPLGTINSRLGAVPRGHTVLLAAELDGIVTPLRPEITFDLRRRGVRALGTGAYFRLGRWYEKTSAPYDYVVWIYDHGSSPIKGARVIASAKIRSGGRPHTVTLVMAPVHPRALGAKAVTPSSRAARGGEATAGAQRSAWSHPSTLDACAAAVGPQVAFPSESPSVATGPGAIVWASEGSRCEPSSTPSPRAPWGLALAALGPADQATPRRARSLGTSSPVALAAVGCSFGRLAVAVALRGAGARAPGRIALLQGRATRALGVAASLGGAGVAPALTRAYLGDAAIATVAPGPTIAVRMERYFRPSFARPQLIAIPPGRVTALTATMDYRADVLLAWQQNGSVYAHMLRASGRAEPTQRIGASTPDPQLRALVSDNDHGMIAWSSADAPGSSAARTHLYIDLSAAGVRFGAPRLLASFSDPAHVGHSPGSLMLVRLSSENVVLAWTDAEHGHYVVRAAPAVFAATRPTTLLSDPQGQAVLSDLAPGPAREAIAVWRASPVGSPLDPSRTELWAARTFIESHDRLAFGDRGRIATAGPNVDPSVAVDPANDRAVTAWLTAGPRPSVQYAISFGASGYHPRPAADALPPPGGGTHWLRITLAAAALAGAVALLGAAMWRRHHPRGP
jgi:hypothetical protein